MAVEFLLRMHIRPSHCGASHAGLLRLGFFRVSGINLASIQSPIFHVFPTSIAQLTNRRSVTGLAFISVNFGSGVWLVFGLRCILLRRSIISSNFGLVLVCQCCLLEVALLLGGLPSLTLYVCSVACCVLREDMFCPVNYHLPPG